MRMFERESSCAMTTGIPEGRASPAEADAPLSNKEVV